MQAQDAATSIVNASDIQLSGTIAQFGRTGLIAEVANVLVADFVHNAEAAMGSNHSSMPDADDKTGAAASIAAVPVAKPISGFALLFMSIKGVIRSWFNRKG